MRSDIFRILTYCIPFLRHLIFNESSVRETLKTNKLTVAFVVLFSVLSLLTLSVNTLWARANKKAQTPCVETYAPNELRKLFEDEK